MGCAFVIIHSCYSTLNPKPVKPRIQMSDSKNSPGPLSQRQPPFLNLLIMENEWKLLHYDGVYIGVIWGYTRIMENKMETQERCPVLLRYWW